MCYCTDLNMLYDLVDTINRQKKKKMFNIQICK